uniref:Putative secreted protein n=1 Tax=Panstrongylus lignarius TaxID=156445 RepID=A0A224XTG3_9HEMI
MLGDSSYSTYLRISLKLDLCVFLSFLALYLCESVDNCLSFSSKSSPISHNHSSLECLACSNNRAMPSPAAIRTSR